MFTQVEFYGPVHIYGRRRHGEWEAWADPFSVVGTGSSFEEAVRDAQRNVNEHLSHLTDAIHRHGVEKVEVVCPLDDELKHGARVANFLLL